MRGEEVDAVRMKEDQVAQFNFLLFILYSAMILKSNCNSVSSEKGVLLCPG